MDVHYFIMVLITTCVIIILLSAILKIIFLSVILKVLREIEDILQNINDKDTYVTTSRRTSDAVGRSRKI